MTSVASLPAYALPGVSVVHPSHLEGDATLATEILPGPPSLLSLQQSTAKRDPKKPNLTFSYLPATDPGSTYSGNMAGTSTLGASDADGPRRKRARIDKGSATGRAQRASARVVNVITPTSDPVLPEGITASSSMQSVIDADTVVVPDDSAQPSLSRSNSSQNLDESISSGPKGKTKGSKKDKGKGKQVDKALIRVKEEEMAPISLSPDPLVGPAGPNNEDHCSACAYMGSLVYCDGCPKAYHLCCLDPPLEPSEVPEGDKWFCPGCTLRKNPPPKPPPSLMSPLIIQAQISASIPREFQIPDDIKSFFKDVGAGPRGAYVDTSQAKKPRLNHYGQIEDREPYRLKDRNNAPVICFKCGTSALADDTSHPSPPSKRPRRSVSKATSTLEPGKLIVSCDYCHLHWHLDCLDPPLASMPPYHKKWMCPNHADKTLLPKRRIPKQNAPPIEITKPRQFNNGNIEVIQPQATSSAPARVVVDEVLINGRRYRVPERVIMLDFWSKISADRDPTANHDAEMSAMSSPLTSLSSLEEDLDDIEPAPLNPPASAQLDPEILAIAQMLCSLRSQPHAMPNGTIGKSVDSVSIQPQSSRNGVVERPKRSMPTRRGTNTTTNNSLRAPLTSSAAPLTEKPSKVAKQPGPPAASSSAKKPARIIKAESNDTVEIPPATNKNGAPKKAAENGSRSSRSVRIREKKDTLSLSKRNTAVGPATSTVVPPPTPRQAPTSTSVPSTPPTSAAGAHPTTPNTPSLKIRLPRLNALNLQSQPVQAPSRSTSFSSTPVSIDSRLRRSSRQQRLSTSASMDTSSSSSSLVSPLIIPPRPNGINVPARQT